MHVRLRFSILVTGVLVAFLLASSFTISPSSARTFTQTRIQSQFIPATLYNNVLLPKPSWWTGTHGSYCDDTNHFNNTSPQTHAIELSSLAVYRGMYACGPATPNYSVYLPKGDPHAVEVREFQCTELAMRYLLTAFGTHPYVADGGGVVWNYQGALFQKVTNIAGSGNVPQAGDIMSYGLKTSGGHVSIVVDSEVNNNGDGYVNVIDENGFTGGLGQHSVSNWFVDGSNDGGTISGWLHTKTLVSSPNPSSYTNQFNAVSAYDASHVWAVGYYTDTNGYHSFIEYWNGAHWTKQTSANPGDTENILYGVKALSATDIWAVGEYVNAGYGYALIEHSTNGGSTWTQDTSSYNGYGSLSAIDGVSSDAWAVGEDGGGNALTLQLASGHFSSKTNVSPNSGIQLNGVSELSSTNVWAVGTLGNNTFSMHYNGSGWSIPTNTTPNPGTSNNLYGVTTIGTSDAWAVGRSVTSGSTGFLTHWNGTSWSSATSLSLGSSSVLGAVAALNSNNIWAVGKYSGGTLVYHSGDGGSTWQQVTSDSSGRSATLNGIAINKVNGNTWAVGDYTKSGYPKTLTEFFN